MKPKFILTCESTVDLPFSHWSARGIPVLFYSYLLDGVSYPDNMQRDPAALPRFYAQLEKGALPVTSQINVADYLDFFEEQIQHGDVLHLVFSSGLSGSLQNARNAAKIVQESHPERQLIVLDSLCGSAGYGLLVDEVADRMEDGMSLEEAANWVLAHRQNIQHQFFSTDLHFFRRSGRVSGPTAAIATILGICPLMHLDGNGRIIAYSKVRGKANAIRATAEEMEAHIPEKGDYRGRCYIAHANCPEEAALLYEAIQKRFPHIRDGVQIFDIGAVIASHCGPGTVSVYFFGDRRS